MRARMVTCRVAPKVTGPSQKDGKCDDGSNYSVFERTNSSKTIRLISQGKVKWFKTFTSQEHLTILEKHWHLLV